MDRPLDARAPLRYSRNADGQTSMNFNLAKKSFDRARLRHRHAREGAKIILDGGEILREVRISDCNNRRFRRRVVEYRLQQSARRVRCMNRAPVASYARRRDSIYGGDDVLSFVDCLKDIGRHCSRNSRIDVEDVGIGRTNAKLPLQDAT